MTELVHSVGRPFVARAGKIRRLAVSAISAVAATSSRRALIYQSINALRVLWIATLSGNPPRCRRPGIIMHSSTTAIEFVALVVRPRHVAALTEITQQAPIVAAFGKRARFVELGVCQYHQRFSDSTYRNAGVWHRAVARQAFGSVHIPRDLSIDEPRPSPRRTPLNGARVPVVCTENLIRIDYVTETPNVSAG